MDIFKRLLRMYIDQWRKVIDNSTVEDALKMGLAGILLVIAGIDEAFHIFGYVTVAVVVASDSRYSWGFKQGRLNASWGAKRGLAEEIYREWVRNASTAVTTPQDIIVVVVRKKVTPEIKIIPLFDPAGGEKTYSSVPTWQ